MKYSLIILKNVCRNYEITDEIQKLAPIFFCKQNLQKIEVSCSRSCSRHCKNVSFIKFGSMALEISYFK